MHNFVNFCIIILRGRVRLGGASCKIHMYYAYVLQNSEGILYKGSSGDLSGRILEHNFGDFKKYTKNKGPWKLVYFENFSTRSEAMIREKFFKTGKGRDFIKAQITRSREIGISQGS